MGYDSRQLTYSYKYLSDNRIFTKLQITNQQQTMQKENKTMTEVHMEYKEEYRQHVCSEFMKIISDIIFGSGSIPDNINRT